MQFCSNILYLKAAGWDAGGNRTEHPCMHTQGMQLVESKHYELLQAVVSALKRLAGKAANLQAQQAATEEAEATRKLADLLTANLHRCQPGASTVEV